MTAEADPTEGHSPLPWDHDWSIPSVWDANGDGVVRPREGMCAADAALIVREVNEAPGLRARVAELEKAAEVDRKLLEIAEAGIDRSIEREKTRAELVQDVERLVQERAHAAARVAELEDLLREVEPTGSGLSSAPDSPSEAAIPDDWEDRRDALLLPAEPPQDAEGGGAA